MWSESPPDRFVELFPQMCLRADPRTALWNYIKFSGRRQALLQEIQCSCARIRFWPLVFALIRLFLQTELGVLADGFRNRPCCPLLTFHVHARLPSPQPQTGNEQNPPGLHHQSINNILLRWLFYTACTWAVFLATSAEAVASRPSSREI